jgi:hypothetical protein
MKVGKVYKEWIQYLKQNGLYVEYMKVYCVVNDYLLRREIAIRNGDFWRLDYDISFNENAVAMTGHDLIVKDKGDNLTFLQLKYYICTLDINTPGSLKKRYWENILIRFGENNGYYKKPSFTFDDSGYLWPDTDYDVFVPIGTAATASTIAEQQHRNRVEEQGQWYDRFYNRGRNVNNRYNIRWRR